ncbi:unnamed protein product [Calypogeia fissa]
MAGRTTHQKFEGPPSPAGAPSSTRFRQGQEESTQQPSAIPKPTTPLYPRSRLARQEDLEAEYSNDTDLWEQSQQYLNGSHHHHGGKRTPDNFRHYSSSTSCAAANKVSRFPGPGAYNVANMKPGGPSFSMGSRSSLRKAERSYSPGPGTYDLNMKNSGPSFSIAPKVRPLVSQQDMNPGPGTYSDLSTAFGRGLSFSIRERFK